MSHLELIDEAVANGAEHLFALFSGGHDSLSATHAAMQHPAVKAVVHINTGIGVKETRQFVRETCAEHGWELREYEAEKVLSDRSNAVCSYRDIVLKWGFPGPAGHRLCYNRLKERCLEQLRRDVGGGVLGLVSGCRSEESRRRMGHVKPIQKDSGRWWINIHHDFTKTDVNDYLARHGLRRSPVVDLIHKSGECLCGAYAKPGELAELAMWFPETAAEIRALEAEVKAAGFPWGWEAPGPPERWVLEQHGQEPFMFMCVGCEKDAP